MGIAVDRLDAHGAVDVHAFNVSGEAIVSSPRDALRTFWSTGLVALAIGRCLIDKPQTPLFLEREVVIR